MTLRSERCPAELRRQSVLLFSIGDLPPPLDVVALSTAGVASLGHRHDTGRDEVHSERNKCHILSTDVPGHERGSFPDGLECLKPDRKPDLERRRDLLCGQPSDVQPQCS